MPYSTRIGTPHSTRPTTGGRRWVQPRVRPEPEWGSPRITGRVWSSATCRTIASPVERDTVSRALGAMFGALVRLAGPPGRHRYHRGRRRG